MFFDPIYWLIIGMGAVLSMLASARVKSAFHQAQQVGLARRFQGHQVARAILNEEGIDEVSVVETHGFLSDHYNPLTRTLALSSAVYHGTNAAAAGVAAHEVGHAIQHARGYSLLWLRSVLVPAAQFGSSLGPLLIIVGLFFATADASGQIQPSILSLIGIVFFGCATLFSLVTVPVEYDASARAKRSLQAIGLTVGAEEDRAVARVLSAAGLTYVAAAAVAILHLLYWAWQIGILGGRDD